ncbi:MAG: ribonuclease R [Pseudomonadota bacterium]
MVKIPSKQALIDWITDNPSLASKRDIAKAFGIKGTDRIELKRLLKELSVEGHLSKQKRSYAKPGELPPVAVLRVNGRDHDGDLWLRPAEAGHSTELPIFYVEKTGDPALGMGDRGLFRLQKIDDLGRYDARLIRKLTESAAKVVGLYRKSSEGGRIVSVDKKGSRDFIVSPSETMGARDGELVEGQRIRGTGPMGLPMAQITEVIGDPLAPKAISLIAIHEHGIPDVFSEEAIAEAEAARPIDLGDRLDLRELPLFTIDPSDARDHDDAICAIPDDDPINEGGFVIWVAIADVAHYVRPGSALDQEARLRGNSTYFADRVVPMLPDALSGDLCSLHEGVDRACIACRIVIDAAGEKRSHRFHRAMMRSPASLSYEQAEAADGGLYDDDTEPLRESLAHLFAAYRAALKDIKRRAPLNLELPERQIVLNDAGAVVSVAFKDRLDAHRLVEAFMVMANVCAAETLESKRQSLLYRVHEEPSPEKLEALRKVVEAAGLTLAKGQVLKTAHLNKLLDAASASEDGPTISMTVLRAMTQAYYAPTNYGHFGLNLKRYAHFTSPIRRYADLIVHRALIRAHGWNDDGLTDEDVGLLAKTGEVISNTERRSMAAERDTTDRYLAAFLSDRVGAEFTGRVSGIAKFGLFIRLDETGADGMVPMSYLGREYWRYNDREKTLKGDDSGRVIAVGMPAEVRLAEAEPITGGLTLEVLTIDGKPLAKGPGAGRRIKTKGRRAIKSRRRKTRA